ncbi:MAG: hypothetical protein LKJ21_07190 [Oscillospiraceae bacterium]|jgi:hypothetical protein|nr:hypothetical protein [Oscillospiraceae bacterium]
MDKMSKEEMLIRVAASAAEGTKLQILTDIGIIECELNNLVSQERIDKNEPCTPMQIALSGEEDSDVQKIFDESKSPKHEFVLLKNAVIHYPSGGACSIGELTLFLDSIEGFSVGLLDSAQPVNN